jgi:DNA-binding transcriptional ArsR family regulator
MRTDDVGSIIAQVLFGKARRAVLSLLYGHPDESFYLRQLVRVTGLSSGTLPRELKLLGEAGIIRRRMVGRQAYYQANPECPTYEELRGLLLKTTGAAEVIRIALARLRDRIDAAFIYGSVAHRSERQASDIDLMVVGRVSFGEVVDALGPAQESLRREINPVIYPPDEYRAKVRSGHHFVRDVLQGRKVFMIGDERELERLG